MKEKIISTCIKCFEQKGFSETSIQDVVDELGVTKGTFYYYFSSKEQVLMTIHRKYIDTLLEQQESIILDSTLTNKGKLQGLIHMLITNIKPQGNSARVFFREFRHLKESHLEEVREKRDQVRLAMEIVIKTGMEQGEFRPDLEPDIVTLGILGACNWSYQWYQPEGHFMDTEVADIFLDMICKGIETK
ncbi:TetR/AcrR family transcriptional regulator [Salinibacillus xinjiangensis]|uniref:TetR family transcriptional regulator n=1 Tax=Salinibacillus xinjiangensis TaxID=1229268 RepID=A0A6G1X794_9BACI|nr:TetR/AcrR family transcriptional regulator [Salinibacillus xinjiangensis]MRG86799.1 TetR family transcriptional regulator [Salinibacillus xinjiangensis]